MVGKGLSKRSVETTWDTCQLLLALTNQGNAVPSKDLKSNGCPGEILVLKNMDQKLDRHQDNTMVTHA